MFRVHGDKIYFLEWEVAKIDPWLRDSVRQDLIQELENHTKARDVAGMKELIGQLDQKVREFEQSPEHLLGAQWS